MWSLSLAYVSETFWFILEQDVDRPIGGVKQFMFLLLFLDLGRRTIVQGFILSSFLVSFPPDLKVAGKIDFNLSSLQSENDILIIPETFLPYLRFTRDLSVIIFNQI